MFSKHESVLDITTFLFNCFWELCIIYNTYHIHFLERFFFIPNSFWIPWKFIFKLDRYKFKSELNTVEAGLWSMYIRHRVKIELFLSTWELLKLFFDDICVLQVDKCESCRRICTVIKIFDIFRKIECLSARYSQLSFNRSWTIKCIRLNIFDILFQVTNFLGSWIFLGIYLSSTT